MNDAAFSERETEPPAAPLPLPKAPGEGWCVLELMGHRTRAGYVSPELLFGVQFVRLDIPWRDPDRGKRTTEHYRPDSVYCINWCTEDQARLIAGRFEPQEVSAPQLTDGSADDDQDAGHFEEDEP